MKLQIAKDAVLMILSWIACVYFALMIQGCGMMPASQDSVNRAFVEMTDEVQENRTLVAKVAGIARDNAKTVSALNPESSDASVQLGIATALANDVEAKASKAISAPQAEGVLSPEIMQMLLATVGLSGLGGGGMLMRKLGQAKRVIGEVADLPPEEAKKVQRDRGYA